MYLIDCLYDMEVWTSTWTGGSNGVQAGDRVLLWGELTRAGNRFISSWGVIGSGGL